MASPGEDVQAWSTTAATNATADPLINWAEGMPRASVNNSARSMLAAHAKNRNLTNGSIVTTGTANAQAFTSGVTYTSVPTGLRVLLKIGVTNTGPATLNMDSIGAVAIKDQTGADIGGNELEAGQYVEFLYNGTNWILLSLSASSTLFDAMAANGMQINGGFEVSQENALGTSVVIGYVCDGWITVSVGTMVAPASIAATSIFGAQSTGFANMLWGSTTTPQVTITAADYSVVIQYIEGYRINRLGWGTSGAQPITLGFMTQHARTGIYSGTIRNNATTRCYAFTYTQNIADAPEYKTITIPGCTDGVWESTNGIGIRITLARACGTTNTAPSAGAWLNGSYLAAPGQINAVAASSDNFRLMGFIALPGIDGPSSAHAALVMRSYGPELEICQRYYFKDIKVQYAGYSAASDDLWYNYAYPVEMRAVPTLAVSGGSLSSAASFSANDATTRSCTTHVVADGTAGTIRRVASGYTLKADARL